MKEVTKYQTAGGKVFDTPEEAQSYEELEAVEKVLYSLDIYWRETGSEEVATKLYEAGYRIVLR